MPTVSAAQAIQNLTTSPDRHIPTGLPSLDVCLQNRAVNLSSDDGLPAGVTRGRVTEIYGPPGVGKTTIGYLFILLCRVLVTNIQSQHSTGRQCSSER
jgi:ABC-type dipeptide/oligopeptide/nickel transport system ATPase subunit